MPARTVNCRFYGKGVCRAGSNCTYTHDDAAKICDAAEGLLANSTLACKYFLMGHCARGGTCRFSHSERLLDKAKASSALDHQVSCVFFLRGHCRNENKCKFPHILASSKAVLCTFFAKGRCLKGNDCAFSHDGDFSTAVSLSGSSAKQATTECIRELIGAWFYFKDGASIYRIQLPSDFSTAKLRNLPSGSNLMTVSELLQGFGFKIPMTSIRVRPQGPKLRSAIIRVKDQQFAHALCTKIAEAGAEQLGVFSRIEARIHKLRGPVPEDGADHGIKGKKVLCSWPKLAQRVHLTFRSALDKEDAREKFVNGTYTVIHSAVSCVRHEELDDIPVEPSTLMIGAPPAASTQHVIETIPYDLRPLNVDFYGNMDDSYETDEVAMIEALLASVGSLEMRLTPDPRPATRYQRAMARFTSEEDAEEAVQTLHNIPLPFNGRCRLEVTQIFSMHWKFPVHLFDALIKDFRTSQDRPVEFKVFPATAGSKFSTLRLECEERDELAALAEELDLVFRGEVVKKRDSEKSLWCPLFNNRATAREVFEIIEIQHNVVFQSLPSSNEIRIYGTLENINRATEKLLQKFDDDPSTVHIIRLDEETRSWLLQGGLKALEDALGREAVSLVALATSIRLEITGPYSSYELAMDMAFKRKSRRQQADVSGCCSVCWTAPENPVVTKCGHVYCSDCFHNFCQSADTDEGEFNVRCLANDGACGHVLGLVELEDYLSTSGFEQLLATSAASYINKHPNEFRYCPSADCGRVYRVSISDDPTVFDCSGCGQQICASCHCAHPDKSCAEQRYLVSGGEEKFQKCKKDFGIRDCPKCQTPIQKSEGCNHMACTRCSTHICWICLATFATGDLCYGHLNKEHQGIYGGDPMYDP